MPPTWVQGRPRCSISTSCSPTVCESQIQDAVDFIHGFTLVSYNAGISACEKGKQWQRALALLSEMSEAM
eukprot:3471045-Pyramimonas_sp.AAC.1